MGCRFSIIIPAYNAESTIEQCLDSILCQEFDQTLFEVIVVNDCSLDRTASIVVNYQNRHNNLRLIKQTVNKKQGAARNIGLANANGEYIIFADADDQFLNKSTLTILDSFMSLSDIDILISNEKNDIGIITGKEYIINNPMFGCQVWGKVYKSEYLRKISPFVEGKFYEDTRWTTEVLYHSSRVRLVNFNFYNYIATETSVTRTFYDQKRIDITFSEIETKNFVEKCPIDEARFVIEKRIFNSVLRAPFGCRRDKIKVVNKVYDLYRQNEMFSFYKCNLSWNEKIRIYLISKKVIFLAIAVVIRLLLLLKNRFYKLWKIH